MNCEMGRQNDSRILKLVGKFPSFHIFHVKGQGIKYWAKSVAIVLCVLTVVVSTILILENRSHRNAFFSTGKISIGHNSDNFKDAVHHRIIREAAVEAEDECIGNLTVTSLGGKITSPGFPDHYLSNQDCRWILNAPDDSKIVLKIETLDIEQARDCQLDYLQIFDGISSLSPSSGPLCGSLQNQVINTNSSKVLIIFHTDPSYEENGFLIHYYIKTNDGCQSALMGRSGIVTHPKFPDNYPENTDCWTLISVADDKTVQLNFDFLDLERDENCTYDYLEIFDGRTTESPHIGRYCTDSQKPNIQSTTNFLLLHFFSDNLINKRGFRAHYTSINPTPKIDVTKVGGCLWEREVSNGTIASPNYPQKYPGNAKCNILLTAPLGENITIIFDSLQLEFDANCSYDYLELFDEIKNVAIGKYCGKLSEPREIVFNKNKLRIIFVSDDFAEFSGFKARYWYSNFMKEDDMIHDIATMSPKAPAVSTTEATMDTFIRVPENATISLGTSHYLQCVFDHPMAKIRWLKDDQFLGGSNPLPGLKMVANNTVWIQSMNKHLVGIYTCAAIMPEKTELVKAWVKMENYSGNNTSCNIVLRKMPKDAYYTEGEFPSMECLAAGAQIHVTWEKNGAPLEIKKHIHVLSTGFLFFDKAVIEDSGLYTCVVFEQATKCEKRISAKLTVSPKAQIQEICGRPRAAQPSTTKPRLDHGKIVGGNNAKRGAYPWQVMLWDKQLKAFCGGTVLNERWIVTAAHCYHLTDDIRWDEIIIKLGKHSREENDREEFQTRITDSSSIIIHPSFNTLTYDNDIALVRLRDHIRFNDYILPACLGDQELAQRVFHTSKLQMGTVTGWGKLTEKGPVPKFLQEIRMPVVDQNTCINSTKYVVTRNMFCAGYSQEIIGDACRGDSGGPFLIKHEEKWYIMGIVSWGEGCGRLGKYGFYTKVNNYYSWIRGIIKS